MKHILTIALFLLPFTGIAQLADSTQRLVKLQGAVNFRDLGGYKTSDGKTVKWGVIYRSADISKLTDADMQVMEQKNIHTVVDFRGVQESAAAPDRLLPGTDYLNCPAGSDSTTTDPKKWMALIKQKDTTALQNFYANTTPFTARYKPFFEKLAQLNGNALLFHCAGGRDRTGIAASLLLYSLGVPYSTIEADYLASNEYLKNWNHKSFSQMAAYLQMPEAEVMEIMKLRPSLLKATFKAIEKQYGSVDAFIEKELGVDKAALRTRFLQ